MPVDHASNAEPHVVADVETNVVDNEAKDTQVLDAKGTWKPLFAYCEDKRTGTLFIATHENKAGQIVLSLGRLVGVAYSGLVNEQAISKLTDIASTSELRFSFSSDLQYPLIYVLDASESEALLKEMGYVAAPEPQVALMEMDSSSDTEEVLPEAKSRKSERIYRGQKVLEETPSDPKSSHRVYRGRVVESD